MPIGDAASGRACACSLHSRLVSELFRKKTELIWLQISRCSKYGASSRNTDLIGNTARGYRLEVEACDRDWLETQTDHTAPDTD